MYVIIRAWDGILSDVINVILNARILQLPEIMDFFKVCWIIYPIRAKEKSEESWIKKQTKDIMKLFTP